MGGIYTNSFMAEIGKLDQIEALILTLGSNPYERIDFAYLQNMDSLHLLHITCSEKPANIDHLASLPNLTEFYTGAGSSITLEDLTGLSHLRAVFLDGNTAVNRIEELRALQPGG